MRKILLTVLVAVLLTAGIFGKRAYAITLIAPSALSGIASDTSIVKKATRVCGPYGCVPVHRRYTYYVP